ncbi:DUF1232 domain-containing protein [Petroclostridium sp. X23]|uniref:YkvA family protein n=1 Tax=Petroclostridium sp. X23 TaxID=3045146 RepID=UPI0024ACA074|nr:DUF1232 domain-containing protein [Petroclostridium sp. X23]WHH57709.1 DUF1232 domain-containing protein [Petroclostridium sp. X23]
MRVVNLKKLTKILKTLMKKAQTEDGRNEIKLNFSNKLKSSKGIDGIINKLKVMYNYFLDPEVSTYKKLIIGAILLYFINPADLMPDLIPGAGFIDDTVAVLYGWNLLKEELENYVDSKRSGVMDEDGEVISDVDYSVDETDEQE